MAQRGDMGRDRNGANAGPVEGYEAEDLARLMALLIDFIFAGGTISVIYLLAATLSPVPVIGGGVVFIALTANAAIGIGYLPLLYAVYGASPGKAVMGLRIVDRNTSLPAANEALVIRGLMQVFLAPVFVGAIYWWKYLDGDGMTVHDRVTQTKVIVVTRPEDSPLLRMRRDLLAALGIRR